MKWTRVIFMMMMVSLCAGFWTGCSSDDDDTTGPGDDPFPATYSGTFRFDGINIDIPFEFTIWTRENVSGTISGTDDQGNYYTYTITGGIDEYTLTMGLIGEYGPPPCAVSGSFMGTSDEDYVQFTGTWIYETCYGVTFTGTWTAARQ